MALQCGGVTRPTCRGTVESTGATARATGSRQTSAHGHRVYTGVQIPFITLYEHSLEGFVAEVAVTTFVLVSEPHQPSALPSALIGEQTCRICA